MTFKYKDYKKCDKQKKWSSHHLSSSEGFTAYSTISKFVYILHYSVLSSKSKTEALAIARRSIQAKTPEKKVRSWQQICIYKLVFAPEACPCCKKDAC